MLVLKEEDNSMVSQLWVLQSHVHWPPRGLFYHLIILINSFIISYWIFKNESHLYDQDVS